MDLLQVILGEIFEVVHLSINPIICHSIIAITHLAMVFFHRRGAEGAESDVFLFAAERPANKKTQALRAKRKSDLRIAWYHITMNCLVTVKYINCRCIFCRRLIVFHLPSSQSQMKSASGGLRSLRLCGEI
jgi:hypothetical protein